MEILRPSHIFAIVEIVGLLLPVLMMLLNVDCVTPQTVLNLFTDILLDSHKFNILCRTAFLAVILLQHLSHGLVIIVKI